MITPPCALPLIRALWPPHPVPDPAPYTTPPACHAPPGCVVAVAAVALFGLRPRPVQYVQVPGEHGRGLVVGALRMPAQSGVHERPHADQGGSSRNHMWKPTREVLHSGKFNRGHIMHDFTIQPSSGTTVARWVE